MGIASMNVLIENLEKLRKNATPGPWLRKTLPTNPDFHFVETMDDVEFPMVFHAKKGDVDFITAACNALPLLLDELEKRERMLEYLAKCCSEVDEALAKEYGREHENTPDVWLDHAKRYAGKVNVC